MFLNELDNNDEKKQEVISPLEHDHEGRFSRKGDKNHRIIYDPDWLDTLLSVLFTSFLLMADFILFAGSGSVKVFENSPEAELAKDLLVVSDNIFSKYTGDAFSNTDFSNFLKNNSIDTVELIQ